RRQGRRVHRGTWSAGRLVGALVRELDNQGGAAWAERIEAELFERGAATLGGMRARTVEREREILQRFLHCGADAVIVISGHHAQERGPLDHYREITSAGVPLVLVNGVREWLEASFRSTDPEHAMRPVLTHLHALVH